MKDILVTGGAGFIGSHLVEALLAKYPDNRVLIIDDMSNNALTAKEIAEWQSKHPLKLGFATEFRHSLLGFDDWDFSHVFHLAAQVNIRESQQQPVLDAQINYLGTIQLLEKLRERLEHINLVFTSSGGALYSHAQPDLGYAEFPTTPATPYGVNKLASEGIIKWYQKESNYKMNFTILRLANVYGPRQGRSGECGVIGTLHRNIQNKSVTYINNSGESTRDFIYVGDVVEAMLLAAEKSTNTALNIGTGIETSVREVVDHFQKYYPGFSSAPNPNTVLEQRHSKLCCSEAAWQLEWRAKTMLTDGIKQLVDLQSRP